MELDYNYFLIKTLSLQRYRLKMLDYFKSRADGTVSADSDNDDDYARMHEGGQQERNDEREQLLKGYGILVQT